MAGHSDERPVLERRRFLLFVLLGMLVAFLVAVLLINFALLPWHVRVGHEATVPDIIGMTQEDAAKALKSKGLALGDVRFVADTLAPVGKIVDTRPRPGSRTKAGRPVGLDISAGQEKTVVPQVFRLPVKRAQAAIENAGLRVGQILSQYSSRVAEGQVVSTEPAAGLKIPKGAAVTMVVSMGSEGVQEMPGLRGRPLEQARDAIINAGLVLGTVTEVAASQAAGTVVEQDPPERSEVQPGDTVKLKIAKAGAAKPAEPKPKTTTTPATKKTDSNKDSGKGPSKTKSGTK